MLKRFTKILKNIYVAKKVFFCLQHIGNKTGGIIVIHEKKGYSNPRKMENKLYYSIGEVSEMVGEPQSVLRFWETEFASLRPVKNKRGVRSYTERDVDLVRRIHYLTRECGFTLDGARDQLRRRQVDDPKQALVNNLMEVRRFLSDLRDTL